jgi:hypothetical protein
LKLVFTAEDSIYLHHLRNILEAQGIECVIKNERLSSLAGEIPNQDCWPELWVIESAQVSRAKQFIETSQQNPEADSQWICENCGEEHSSRFTDCWNCQSTKAF